MNVKKFLIISSMALQFSTIMYASQANFNAAFLTFGGGTDLVVAATNVQNNKGNSTTRGTSSGLTALHNSAEAMIVSKYLTNQSLTSAETTSLTAAFASAKGQSSTTTTGTTTPTTSTTTGTTAPTTSTTTTGTTTTPTTSTTTGTTTTPTTSTTTTTTPTTTTTTPTTADQAAVALKTQIDASLVVYNSYLTSVSQPQVKIAVAA